MSPLARLDCVTTPLPDVACEAGYVLIVMPRLKKLPDNLPAAAQLTSVLKRRDLKPEGLAKSPVAIDLPQGGRCAYVMVDGKEDRHTQQGVLRKAAMLLIEETPAQVTLAVCGALGELRQQLVRDALYVLWINGAALPTRKKKPARSLKRLLLQGVDQVTEQASDYADVAALAQANLLARQLTALPPNELTPTQYREKIRTLAQTQAWAIEEFDFRKLHKMGAGAFCAVAQGSHEEDAAIVHLSYRPPVAQGRGGRETCMPRVALVGKGICFDTGGHNLKPARYMMNMHEDMNGSAVALALLQAIEALALPVVVDVWLAIA